MIGRLSKAWRSINTWKGLDLPQGKHDASYLAPEKQLEPGSAANAERFPSTQFFKF
jgi:hypothetical protein